ncbi:uncharacterized protein [Primulina huaijiensis]|uniref:uncharacterized protein n=1 Tax=Primulina huaijiensis TaxID=1492673 RepID=UPI003CC758E7
MTHPSDSPAWRHFDEMHPSFASEIQNVRLGMSTDGFQLFGQSGQQYSSWLVIVTPYNLPPWMCMKEEYMFLTVIVPRPHNPKDKLNVFLQPLIAELQSLWCSGVQTYDMHSKQNFNLRVALLWTISDFPAYVMLSGWSTAGNGKTSWFDNHRKFLPEDHPLHRNRVMFIRGRRVLGPEPIVKQGDELLNELDEYGFRPSYEVDSETINKEIASYVQCGWRRRIRKDFPPSFFDSMEHLCVHLPFEARIAGPVQFRWMYPFERFLRKLKNTVRNKARVEGSICNAYLVKEASIFCQYYFNETSTARGQKRRQHQATYEDTGSTEMLSIFRSRGRKIGAGRSRWLTADEYQELATYILLNCEEITPFVRMYEDYLHRENPHLNDANIDSLLHTNLFGWFKNYAELQSAESMSPMIKQVAAGPFQKVNTYRGYNVNGFNFHTVNDTTYKATNNSGIQVSGQYKRGECTEYYGQVQEVIEVEYSGLPLKQAILFKCSWFDINPRSGTRVHSKYKIVDVNCNRSLGSWEPFVFATQASQVVYLRYPTTRRAVSEWMYVSSLRQRAYVSDVTASVTSPEDITNAFQNNDSETHAVETHFLLASQNLVDVDVVYDIEMDVHSLIVKEMNLFQPTMTNDNVIRVTSLHTMSGHRDDSPPPPLPDNRIELTIRDGIFFPNNSRVSRYISAQFSLQTCDPGWSLRYVTPEQRQWYWEQCCVRDLWFRTTATLYRRTIHGWRTSGHHPQTVTPERWAAWTATWQQQDWQDRAAKNKANRNSEPVGQGTGTTKHIAGAKTYSAHGQDLRARHGRDPTSWELYVHTHRHDDGSFVDTRSRLLHEEMERYMAESMTPVDDGSEHAVPSPRSVNSMFKSVVGGKKKGRMYGCGSMASTLYPDEMAPGRRGGSSGVCQSSQSQQMADMRHTLDSSLRRNDELYERMQATDAENAMLRDRMVSLEEQVRVLVAGMSQEATAHTSGRTLLGPGTFHRGRSRGASVASSSRTPRLSQSYVPPTQGYGDGDDDETQSPEDSFFFDFFYDICTKHFH